MLHEFEKAFAGEIINPNDLIIKEQIGEGEYLYTTSYGKLIHLNILTYHTVTMSQLINVIIIFTVSGSKDT